MLIAGLGMGALASQLGSVTVSAVPDEQSAEVGGVQNTLVYLGASLGTALAGAVLVSALTASFFSGVDANPAVPDDLSSAAKVELASGVPFMSDDAMRSALVEAQVDTAAVDAIVAANEDARLAGPRSPCWRWWPSWPCSSRTVCPPGNPGRRPPPPRTPDPLAPVAFLADRDPRDRSN